MSIRPDMSGMSFLCRLRASVKSFPMYVAFPRSEYYASIKIPHRHPAGFPFHSTPLPSCTAFQSAT